MAKVVVSKLPDRYLGTRITSYNVCYTKLLRLERPVVKIGSQGDDQSHPAAGGGNSVPEEIQKMGAVGLMLNQGEDLFKLVDDEDQLAVV